MKKHFSYDNTWITVLVTTVALLLSSCGFHLRGTETSISWLKAGIGISAEDQSNVWYSLLKPRLEAASIPVVEPSNQAPFKLKITKERLNQNITAVSSSTTPRQYQLTYEVWFSLVNARGKAIIKSTHIVITRPLTINNDRVLGSRNEGEKLKVQMRKQAADKIVEYLYQKDTAPQSASIKGQSS